MSASVAHHRVHGTGRRWVALLASLGDGVGVGDGDDDDGSASARAGLLIENAVLPHLQRGLAPRSAAPLPFSLAEALAARPEGDDDADDCSNDAEEPVRHESWSAHDQLAWRVLTLAEPVHPSTPLKKVTSLTELDFAPAYDFVREWLADDGEDADVEDPTASLTLQGLGFCTDF